MEPNEFEQDMAINPGQLDVEACRQAELFYKWAKKSVEARAIVDQAKFHLDVTEARLQMECRRTPENFGLTKITEAVVQAAAKCDERYTKAYKAYIDARENSALLDKATESMEQKKRMIEVLITLHGQQYFAGPNVPHDLVQTMKDHQRNSSEKLHTDQRSRLRRRGEVRE